MVIKDKLAKVGEDLTVTRYDNGYKVEVRGENANGDWATAQILTADANDLVNLVLEFLEMERDA